MIYNLMYSLNYGYTDDVRCVPFLKILIMGPVSQPAGSLGVHITLTSALFCVRNLCIMAGFNTYALHKYNILWKQ